MCVLRGNNTVIFLSAKTFAGQAGEVAAANFTS
jgi:hypothetical protein